LISSKSLPLACIALLGDLLIGWLVRKNVLRVINKEFNAGAELSSA
jgi:hypothetical protein